MMPHLSPYLPLSTEGTVPQSDDQSSAAMRDCEAEARITLNPHSSLGDPTQH